MRVLNIPEDIADKEKKIEAAYQTIDYASHEVEKACEALKAAEQAFYTLIGEQKNVFKNSFEMIESKQKEILRTMRNSVNIFSKAVYAAQASITPCKAPVM